MVEALTGDSSLAATEVKLHVDFNPRAVAAYRLIGHDSTAVGGLLPAAVETDLHVGQTASALFEVWLYPNDEDDVATVRVQWSDPAEGKSRQAGPQRVSRLQFATAFEGSALIPAGVGHRRRGRGSPEAVVQFRADRPRPVPLRAQAEWLGARARRGSASRCRAGRNSLHSGGSSSCWKPCPGWGASDRPCRRVPVRGE